MCVRAAFAARARSAPPQRRDEPRLVFAFCFACVRACMRACARHDLAAVCCWRRWRRTLPSRRAHWPCAFFGGGGGRPAQGTDLVVNNARSHRKDSLRGAFSHTLSLYTHSLRRRRSIEGPEKNAGALRLSPHTQKNTALHHAAPSLLNPPVPSPSHKTKPHKKQCCGRRREGAQKKAQPAQCPPFSLPHTHN